MDKSEFYRDARSDLTGPLSGIRVVAYDLPSGCAAMYFPEANALVAAGNFAEKSRTPAYKSIVVSLAPAQKAEGATA